MTLLTALNRIHALLEGDTSTPLTGEDYTLRVLLINDAIDEWSNQTTRWRELYATDTSNTGDGIETRFEVPTDFRLPNGYIYLTDADGQEVAVQPVQTSAGYGTADDGVRTYWIEGNEIVFSEAPADGTTISIPYYAKATELTTNTQELPMSNPRYVIHYVVARLTEQSGDYTRYNTNMQKAEELMSQMRIHNESLGEGVPDTVQSVTAGFGI